MAETEDNRTMAELAKEALDVQYASNLSGVAHSFSRSISRLRILLREKGCESTAEVSGHPIVVLFLEQMHSLAFSHYGKSYANAYDAVIELQSAVPDAVRSAILRYCQQHQIQSTDIDLKWDALNRHYYFHRAGMYHGVELDGHIHT